MEKESYFTLQSREDYALLKNTSLYGKYVYYIHRCWASSDVQPPLFCVMKLATDGVHA